MTLTEQIKNLTVDTVLEILRERTNVSTELDPSEQATHILHNLQRKYSVACREKTIE